MANVSNKPNLQIILNVFIAIDGTFSESKADIALELLDKIDGSMDLYDRMMSYCYVY